MAAAPEPIRNIALFLERCPQEDPAYERIRFDVEIRRNGVLVTDIPCTGVASALPIDQFTDELITLQGLRVLYHMDAGLSNHLPWTDKRAYEWFVSKVGGINHMGATPACCSRIGDRIFISLPQANVLNRELDRNWESSSANIGVLLHEARHRDGHPHVSCCGIERGCDAQYSEEDLSAFGLQFWVTRAFLDGDINVGMGCLGSRTLTGIASSMLAAADGYRRRFCDAAPPPVALPGSVGGPCQTTG